MCQASHPKAAQAWNRKTLHPGQSESSRRELIRQQPGHVHGLALGAVVNLVAAAGAIGHHNRIGLLAHRGQQAGLGHLHGDIEVAGLVASQQTAMLVFTSTPRTQRATSAPTRTRSTSRAKLANTSQCRSNSTAPPLSQPRSKKTLAVQNKRTDVNAGSGHWL